ncbi:MAG: aminotransferase class V-fold PLP-dependent enzyme [Pirellulales bacterium]
MGIFEELGVEPIINASGAVTRLGGAPLPQPVLEAFCQAAQSSVPLELLQAAASRRIAAATGAEAGLVTSGASAALLLGAAAMLAGDDLGRMERLPDCRGFPAEMIVAREQRNPYDHAVRAAGARLVEVGFHEPAAGSGVRRCEVWEYAAAITSDTAGILYVQQDGAQPPLGDVVSLAHSRGLPVLVDAAGELPPRSNLRELLATGADLVAFSGGKALRGPQATGILAGRRPLVASAALQMLDLDDHSALWQPPVEFFAGRTLPGLPRQGIGRTCKVSKEQIAALLVALELFQKDAYQSERTRQCSLLSTLTDALRTAGIAIQLRVPADDESAPWLEVAVDASRSGASALEVCRRLRAGRPPVYVGHGQLAQQRLVIHPLHLDEATTRILARRLVEELT